MSDDDVDSVFTSAEEDFGDLFEYAPLHSDTSIEEEFGPDNLPDLQTVTESDSGYSDFESVAQYSTVKSVYIAPLTTTVGAVEVLAIAEGDTTARNILLDFFFSDEPGLTLDLTSLDMFRFPNLREAVVEVVFSGIHLHGSSQPTMPESQAVDGETYRFIFIFYPPW